MTTFANALVNELMSARDSAEEQLLSERSMEPRAHILAFDESTMIGDENVVGVGIGEKDRNGEPTGDLAVKVYVVDKAPADAIQPQSLVPEEISGHPTDVEEVGIVTAGQLRTKFRPAPGGCSIGHKDITAGTLGAFVKADGEIAILSNNHVLANSNEAEAGDHILQPGPADGGTDPEDKIAQLHSWVPITFGGSENYVDAALATPDPDWFDSVTPFILQIGEVRGSIEPALGLQVQKMGRTTKLTHGQVTGVGVTIGVRYGNRVARFREQVQIRGANGNPFSLGGDSGSLILTEDNSATSLLFAGSNDGSSTFASPILTVIDQLKEATGAQELDLVKYPW